MNLEKKGFVQQMGAAVMAHIRKSWEDFTNFIVINTLFWMQIIYKIQQKYYILYFSSLLNLFLCSVLLKT